MHPAETPPKRTSAEHDPNPQVARQRARHGIAITALGILCVILAAIIGVLKNHNQDREIMAAVGNTDALSSVVAQQNAIISEVCQLAGGEVNRAPSAAEACQRVAAGKPAVSTPSPIVISGQPGINGANGANGVGIDHIDQDGACYVNVVLTNHATSRFGPFCGPVGPAGPAGPTGPAGPSGASGIPGSVGPSGANGLNGADGQNGQNGQNGVGIADIANSSDRCYAIVSLTDGSSRTIGPFCGSPAQQITLTLSDGSVQNCSRSGGSDSGPAYSCATPPPATTPTPTS